MTLSKGGGVDGLVSSMLAVQSWGPELDPQHPKKSQRQWRTPVIPALAGGDNKNIPGEPHAQAHTHIHTYMCSRAHTHLLDSSLSWVTGFFCSFWGSLDEKHPSQALTLEPLIACWWSCLGRSWSCGLAGVSMSLGEDFSVSKSHTIPSLHSQLRAVCSSHHASPPWQTWTPLGL